MNDFQILATGILAKDLELIAKGDMTYSRFCLVGSERTGSRAALGMCWRRCNERSDA